MRTKAIFLILISSLICESHLTQNSYGHALSIGNLLSTKETILFTPPQKSLNNKTGLLEFLSKYNGKYPFEVKLLNNPTIKKRLQHLLGVQQYTFVKEIMEVETPIEVKDGLFYAEGMQAHSGGDPSAVIMADILKDILFVGIFKDGKASFFAEGNAEPPLKLKDWADSLTNKN